MPPRLSAFALVVLLGLLGALASPVAAQTPPSTDATLSGRTSSATQILGLEIKGTVNGGTTSTDATLSALTVNDGTNDLTLDPAFASGT